MESQSNEQIKELPPIEMNRLIEGVEFETYAQSAGMNASGLKEIIRSPSHYYESKYNRRETKDSPALQFGRLFHFAVLEPVLFRENYTVRPKFDLRTKAGKEGLENWNKDLKPSAIIVPEEFVEPITRMVDKILNHKIAARMLDKGVRETTMWWNDRETGELSKMRPDFVSEKWGIIDLKTTRDAQEEAFKRDIMKYKYHVQAAHYTEGARTAGVCRHDTFTFIAIEKDAPHEIAVYPSGTSVLGVGEQWRSKAMRTYSDCKKTNQWPGYNHKAQVIELPTWAEVVDPDEEY